MNFQKYLSKKWILVCSLFGSAAFYLGISSRYQVGYFNDDAIYILGAQSLLHGHYSALFLPHPAPLNDPLPGYSLFLAPFVGLFHPHWALLKIVSVVVMVAVCFLYGLLLEQWFPWGGVVSAMILLSLNPLTARVSHVVMSETFFVLLMLLVFLNLKSVLISNRAWSVGCLAGLLAWAALVRPQGILLIPSVMAGLFYAQKRRISIQVGFIALAVYGSVLWRNWVQTGSFIGYFQLWSGTGQFFQTHGSAWWGNISTFLRILFVRWLIDFEPVTAQGDIFIWVLGVLLSLTGGVFLWKSSAKNRPILLAIVLFSLSYIVLQTFWLATDNRYFFPILPFVLAACLAGMRVFVQRFRGSWMWLCLVGLLLLYGKEDFQLIQQNSSEAFLRSYRLPFATYQWIQQKMPLTESILTSRPATLYLYTQHPALSLDVPENSDQFRSWLLAKGVRTVLYEANSHILSMKTAHSQTALQVWENSHSWTVRPNGFEKIYENAAEGTVIYYFLRDH